MKKTFVLTTLLCSVLIFSCHQKPAAASAGNTAAVSSGTPKQAVQPVKAAMVDPSADMTDTGAPYTVDSISINGDILSVFVNYSGGCKEHSFELLSNGMYAKSLPPQISVCLKHTGNGDNCRELVMTELKFDVTALKYKGGNATVIKLGDKKVTCTAK